MHTHANMHLTLHTDRFFNKILMYIETQATKGERMPLRKQWVHTKDMGVNSEKSCLT